MDTPLHADDIVAKKSDERSLAVVERTHSDIDTHAPYPARDEPDPITHDRSISSSAFRNFMRDGVPPKDTALIRYQNIASLELIPTSKLKLVDRSLLIGDIVKRNVHDAQSGTILNTFTKCTLQPMCDVTYQNSATVKGLLPHITQDPGNSQFTIYPNGKPEALVDIPALELTYAEALTEDDLVIYKDWIGRVQGITNMIQLKLSDNCVVEVADDLGEHPDGSLGAFCISTLR